MNISHPTAIGVDCLKQVREGVWCLLMWWSSWDILIYVFVCLSVYNTFAFDWFSCAHNVLVL